MARKALLIGGSIMLALLLVLVSSLALAWATPQQHLTTATSDVLAAETQQENNLILGHARTDEAPQRPVQNARIIAARVGTGEQATALTGADGAYTLTLPVGIATWQVHAETTDDTIPPGVIAPAQPHLVVFGRQAETKTGIDFIFQVPTTTQEAHIVGRVLISDTNPIVPTFPVTVTAVQLPDVRASVSTRIDPADGAFDLTVPPGHYQVAVIPEDLTAYLPPVIAPFSVDAGQTHDLGDLYLVALDQRVATLQGHVMTVDNQPAPGVRVVAVKVYNPLSTGSPQTPTVRYTDTGGQGEFSLMVTAGTWWVAVALSPEDPYMPYRLQWQTVVSVEEGGTVDDILLRVMPATAHVLGTLVQEGHGDLATDACGVVAAFKQGEPAVYSYRTFVGETFDLPVVSGTYRLAVLPNPDLEQLGLSVPGYPPSCEPGKYLVRTIREVAAEGETTTTITVPLRLAETMIHGHLWDVQVAQDVAGVRGLLFGWSPDRSDAGGDGGQGTWSAAQIDPETGVGDLRAGAGDWLLAYQVDPNTGYHVMPGVISMTVPPGTPEMDVNLPVIQATGTITGRVIAPDGSGVRGVMVVAAGISQAGSLRSLPGPGKVPVGFSKDVAVVTNEDGTFALALSEGSYLVSVFGPPELLQGQGDQLWISPQPQLIRLQAGQPAPPLVLQFRSGDATIHGQLRLADTAPEAGEGTIPQLPALVWAATASGATSTVGHTKALVELSETGEGEYSLPAIQGQRWVVGAVYEVGASLWITQTVVSVDAADISLDLTLAQVTLPVTGTMQSINPNRSFYAELANGASVYIPAGALSTAGRQLANEEALPGSRILVSIQTSLVSALANFAGTIATYDRKGGVEQGQQVSGASLSSLTAIQGVSIPMNDTGYLVSPVYEIMAQHMSPLHETVAQGAPGLPSDTAEASSGVPGNAVTDETSTTLSASLNGPILLRIPYDEAELAANGIPESGIQVWRIPYDESAVATQDVSVAVMGANAIQQDTTAWEPVTSYVVDEANNQVVIFADELGSYALVTTAVRRRVFLPLLIR